MFKWFKTVAKQKHHFRRQSSIGGHAWRGRGVLLAAEVHCAPGVAATVLHRRELVEQKLLDAQEEERDVLGVHVREPVVRRHRCCEFLAGFEARDGRAHHHLHIFDCATRAKLGTNTYRVRPERRQRRMRIFVRVFAVPLEEPPLHGHVVRREHHTSHQLHKVLGRAVEELLLAGALHTVSQAS